MSKTSVIVAMTCSSLCPVAVGQEEKAESGIEVVSGSEVTPAPEEKARPSTSKPEPSQEQREAKFVATLTNATLAGRWCLIKDGKLTPEKEDKYGIRSVSKLPNGSWIIKARIQFGKFDMVLPVPVKVEWAGDTPVIIVDGMGLPGGNLYSARVVVYDDSYAGTWSGGPNKGLLSGMITREKPEKKEQKEQGNPQAQEPKEKPE